MARGLLAEGRVADVARMVEPLLPPGTGADGEDTGLVVLRTLMARVRLLRHGDARRAHALLAPHEPLIDRKDVDPNVRAEVALWLGWAHAWEDVATYDDARALYFFDRAERLFRQALNAGGRCWTLLGQAHAYFGIDEVQLMRQALDEAAVLEETLQDVQATLWLQDLHTRLDRFQGRYACARLHLDRLAALAHTTDDPMARGRALAYQALLDADLGRAPETVLESARAAEHLLAGDAASAGRPLLDAFRSHLRALIRKGDLDGADRLIDRARRATTGIPDADAYLLEYRARLALIRGDHATAGDLLDELLRRLHHRRHQSAAASVALVRSQLLERQGQHERATEWAHRAYHSAREAAHDGRRLETLLHLAHLYADRGELGRAREYLRESETLGEYFSLLPFAARRFYALGHLARTEGHADEARAYFTQALSAYSLIGDVYQTARMQLALARLGRSVAPAQTRPLLDTAVLTFSRLQARPELDEARALQAAWPTGAEGTPEMPETALGASLAQASLSVELVAEAWLQAAERLLPNRWLGLYTFHEDAGWSLLHQHGTPPDDLAFPSPTEPRSRQGAVVWLRLHAHGPCDTASGPAFFFGVAAGEDDPAWEVAEARLRPWLPVAALALDHARLRARRLTAALPDDVAHNGEPEIPLKDFVYASAAMRQVARQIHRIRASHSPVLITGESGTGKELIARAVHATSERKHARFLAFNCSTVPRELFESHLFGHEKGAFTGAVRAHAGVIREAAGGTLFLDEIADLPLDVQPKLLRFLQEGEIFPLGARRPVQVNVRIIAATNQDLEALIRAGRFRQDLYYRLNVIPLRVPPLRERREEIPLLVRHFLQQLRPAGTPVASITNRALDALLRYDWPGNVRQLRNEIERALVYVSSEPAPTIDLEDLSPTLLDAVEGTPAPPPGPHDLILRSEYNLDDVLAGTEKALIERVLTETGGQVTAAADVLGLTRQGLYKKMKRLGIDPARFQQRPAGHTGASVLQAN
ncbi:MAG: hypothetical protein KatS3mg043_0012 [Rhodothermaceae bacterium]|nr:MAG: hypothetical protein KatS3mg043_0012 [Rhodothermaceae bacterium]